MNETLEGNRPFGKEAHARNRQLLIVQEKEDTLL